MFWDDFSKLDESVPYRHRVVLFLPLTRPDNRWARVGARGRQLARVAQLASGFLGLCRRTVVSHDTTWMSMTVVFVCATWEVFGPCWVKNVHKGVR